MMNGTSTTKMVVTNPYVGLLFYILVLFVLPTYGAVGGMAMMVVCAGYISMLISVMPDVFRGRNGSLTMAICLAAWLWLGAALVIAMTLMGQVS